MGKFRELVAKAKANVAAKRREPLTIQEDALVDIMINDPTCRDAFQGKGTRATQNKHVFNLAYRPDLADEDPIYLYRLRETSIFIPQESVVTSASSSNIPTSRDAQKKGAEGFFSSNDISTSIIDENNLVKLKSDGLVYSPTVHNWESNTSWMFGIIHSNRPVMLRSMPQTESLKRTTAGVPEDYSAFAKEMACLGAAGYRCEIIGDQIQFVPPAIPNNVSFRHLMQIPEDSIRLSFYAFRDTFLQYTAPESVQNSHEALKGIFNMPITKSTQEKSFEQLEENILSQIADHVSDVIARQTTEEADQMMRHFPVLKMIDDQDVSNNIAKITLIHFFHQLGEKILQQTSTFQPNTQGINHPFIKSLEKAALEMLDEHIHDIVHNTNNLKSGFCDGLKTVITEYLANTRTNTLLVGNRL